jgi:hypothetical protein
MKGKIDEKMIIDILVGCHQLKLTNTGGKK